MPPLDPPPRRSARAPALLAAAFVAAGVASCRGACTSPPPAAIRVDERVVAPDELAALARARHLDAADPARLESFSQEIVARILLAQEARRRGLDRTPALRARLDESADTLLAAALEESLATEVATDEKLRAWYAAHGDRLGRRQVDVSHVTVFVAEDAPVEALAAARGRLGAAYQALREGKPIDEVVRTYADPRAATGERPGHLGIIWAGRTDARFVDAALALHAGGFSEPIRTENGLHIVYAHTEPETFVPPFDEAAGTVRRLVVEEARAALAERLRAAARIEARAVTPAELGADVPRGQAPAPRPREPEPPPLRPLPLDGGR